MSDQTQNPVASTFVMCVHTRDRVVVRQVWHVWIPWVGQAGFSCTVYYSAYDYCKTKRIAADTSVGFAAGVRHHAAKQPGERVLDLQGKTRLAQSGGQG